MSTRGRGRRRAGAVVTYGRQNQIGAGRPRRGRGLGLCGLAAGIIRRGRGGRLAAQNLLVRRQRPLKDPQHVQNRALVGRAGIRGNLNIDCAVAIGVACLEGAQERDILPSRRLDEIDRFTHLAFDGEPLDARAGLVEPALAKAEDDMAFFARLGQVAEHERLARGRFNVDEAGVRRTQGFGPVTIDLAIGLMHDAPAFVRRKRSRPQT